MLDEVEKRWANLERTRFWERQCSAFRLVLFLLFLRPFALSFKWLGLLWAAIMLRMQWQDIYPM